MKSLHARVRCDSGQAVVFVALVLVVLVGMAALVIDVGSWYQADRQAQTAADASALAGAQMLPERGDAEAVASEYLSKNPDNSTTGGPLEFPDPAEPAYQITVKVIRETDGFFAKVFGIDSATVAAEAQAQVTAPLELKNVAPIAVHKEEACIVTDPSCFGKTVILTFDELDVTKSKFGLLDLDRSGGAGAGEMKCWIENGYSEKCGNSNYLPVNVEYPDAGGNKNGIHGELKAVADHNAAVTDPEDKRVLLFPVFDTPSATGFYVIGWAAFVIDKVVNWNGDEKPGNHVLTGHFVTFIATDVAAGGTISDPDLDFGVHVITLTH